jgi:hypothetical protein
VHLLAELWVEAVAPDARRAELWSERRTTEFEAMLRHAIGKVVAKPEAELVRLHDDIAGIPVNAPPKPERDRPVIDVDHDRPAAPAGLFLDWHAFANRDSDDHQWLVEGLWPTGRALALWAAAKTGKSELALWCAVRLALGRHPWTGAPIPPVDVAYFDYEMTEDDLDDRLADFGEDPATLDRLHYALLPPLPALDVEAGGLEVERAALAVGARAVVIDTFGRAVAGEENEADTVRSFYRYTGSRLKRNGIGYLRTDHAGKDHTKGQRGSSAKRDDVDIVWRMRRGDGTAVLLDCEGSSRLSWVGPRLVLDRIETGGLVAYTTPTRIGWPAGTAAKAAELDAIGYPVRGTKRGAQAALKEAGHVGGRNAILLDALRYRRERAQEEAQAQRTHRLDHGSRSAGAKG